MRTTLLALLAALTLVALASAATAHAAAPAAPAVQQQRPVDQHDGSRVAVQLAVLGGAAVVVVVFGSGAYFLRRKLGLTALPPASGDPHH